MELASAYHLVEEIEGGPGELAGEGQFISEGPRWATVTAITEVKALVWKVQDWKHIAEQQPLVGYRLAVFIGDMLAGRIVQLRQHLINDLAWGID